MDKKLKLAIDIDGVLADFNSSYNRVLQRVSGREGTLKPGEEPNTWYWPRHYGFTKDHEDAAWREIEKDPGFWYSLKSYIETYPALAMLSMLYKAGHSVTFITSRPGINSHMQTVAWLVDHGMSSPQVIVADKKGPIIKALGITHFLDDKPQNCEEVIEETVNAGVSVFMLKRAWNDKPEYRRMAEQEGIAIVSTIREFFDSLVLEEKANAIVV